jgi:hypothetical protein
LTSLLGHPPSPWGRAHDRFTAVTATLHRNPRPGATPIQANANTRPLDNISDVIERPDVIAAKARLHTLPVALSYFRLGESLRSRQIAKPTSARSARISKRLE